MVGVYIGHFAIGIAMFILFGGGLKIYRIGPEDVAMVKFCVWGAVRYLGLILQSLNLVLRICVGTCCI